MWSVQEKRPKGQEHNLYNEDLWEPQEPEQGPLEKFPKWGILTKQTGIDSYPENDWEEMYFVCM